MFTFEGRTKKDFNKNELTAMRNTYHAFNNIVGMHYNDIQDNCPEYLPKSRETLFEEIYEGAMNNLYFEGYEGYNKAPREMRFAGEKFVRAYIDHLITYDECCLEIAEEAGW